MWVRTTSPIGSQRCAGNGERAPILWRPGHIADDCLRLSDEPTDDLQRAAKGSARRRNRTSEDSNTHPFAAANPIPGRRGHRLGGVRAQRRGHGGRRQHFRGRLGERSDRKERRLGKLHRRNSVGMSTRRTSAPASRSARSRRAASQASQAPRPEGQLSEASPPRRPATCTSATSRTTGSRSSTTRVTSCALSVRMWFGTVRKRLRDLHALHITFGRRARR
jgi:hypothetical protein